MNKKSRFCFIMMGLIIQFPNTLKRPEKEPTFKKDERSDKENYRPISFLPSYAVSKIYEKMLCDQLIGYFDSFFSQCGFRKGYSAE